MAKLTHKQWDKARAKYEAGASGNSVAEQYGVSRGTVQNRIKRDGWVQDLELAIQRKTSQKMAGCLATRSEKETAKAVDIEADRRVVVIRKHQKLAEQAIALQQQAIGKQEADEDGVEQFTPNFETQKSAKINAETVAILVNLERKIYRVEGNDGQEKGADIFMDAFTTLIDKLPN